MAPCAAEVAHPGAQNRIQKNSKYMIFICTQRVIVVFVVVRLGFREADFEAVLRVSGFGCFGCCCFSCGLNFYFDEVIITCEEISMKCGHTSNAARGCCNEATQQLCTPIITPNTKTLMCVFCVVLLWLWDVLVCCVLLLLHRTRKPESKWKKPSPLDRRHVVGASELRLRHIVGAHAKDL